ncbi:MAG: hypothetical protein KGH55_01735 [Nanoarchaeota archaeon]|nr:hypothetical protein [Nanoarchaeota archaeon]
MKDKMRLNTLKFGISGGIVWAFVVLGVSIFANNFPTWEMLIHECYGFLGYNPSTFLGVVLGVVYGFIDGFVGFFVLAWIYNLLNKKD